MAKGRVEAGAVTQHRDFAIWFLLPHYTAELGYSYSVNGAYYSGYIEKSFFRERAAKKFVERLRDQGVLVRFNPSSPRISILRSKDQELRQLQPSQATSGKLEL